MTYTSVSGSLFKKMVINGAINLKNDLKEIDDLNVFPVPDGDTGTNMSMTMMSGVRDIQNSDTISISEISKTLSRGLLMGARGNSGVILSQFFRGIYTGMENIKGSSATVNEFIDCLVSGYKVAYKAVMTPVEGTILTVMREAGEKVDETRNDFSDIESVLVKYVEYAEVSLANTPNILPVLKDAGVVDSGGAGFLKVIKGMLMALQGITLEITSTEASTNQSAQANFDSKDIKFGYCTEFILILNKPNEFQESDLRSPLSIIGDSLVLVKDEDLCKVHVHTNNPGRALNMAQRHGEFKTIKIENMRLQHTELLNKETTKKEEPVTPVTPVSTEKKKYALIAVCFGDGIKNVFKELGVDYIIDGGQTMNPSTEDFVKAVETLNAENIIIIPNNSNVIMAAEQTKKLCDNANIEVLRTKTIAHGYASLMVFDETNSLEDNVEEMSAAIKNVSAGEVTYAVRDTEINGVKIKSGDFMGILNGEIVISTLNRIDAVKHVLESSVTEESLIVTLFAGKGVPTSEVDELVEYATSLNEEIEVQVVDGKQDIYSYIVAVE
jgi:DAK2 domain fusion protein YloV